MQTKFVDPQRNRVGIFQLIEDVDQTDLKTAFDERVARTEAVEGGVS